MAIIIKSLADDQLVATASPPATDSLSYQTPSSPAARTAVVRSVRMTNADAAIPATIQIECRTAIQTRDTSGQNPPPLRKAAPVATVVPANGTFVLDDEITLGAGDELKVTLLSPTTGTSKLDVVISGIEREVP